MVDNDDTGAVLAAYGDALAAGVLDGEAARRVSVSRDLGRDWLLGMQNPDGGWSAFVHGLPAKRPGPLFSGPVEVSLDDPVVAVRTLLDPPRELPRRSVHRGPHRPRARRPRPRRTDDRVAGSAARDRVPAGAAVRPRRVLGAVDRELPGFDRVRTPGARARRRQYVRTLGPARRRLRAFAAERRRRMGRAPRLLPRPRAGRSRSQHAPAHRPRADRADRRGRGDRPTPSRVGSRTCSISNEPTGRGRTATGSRRSCRPTPSTSWPRRPSTIRSRRSPAGSKLPERCATPGAGTGCPPPRPTSGRSGPRAGRGTARPTA